MIRYCYDNNGLNRRKGYLSMLWLWLFNGIVGLQVRAACVSTTISSGDYTMNCDWLSNANRVLTFSGNSLTINTCKFESCGTYSTDENPGCVLGTNFGGNVVIQKLTVRGVLGGCGALRFANGAARRVTFTDCVMEYGHFGSRGFVSFNGDGNQPMTVEVNSCKFYHCYVTNGNGCISGHQSFYFIDNCQLVNCTVGLSDHSGGFLHFHKVSNEHLHGNVRYCTFDNQEIAIGNSPSGFTFDGSGNYGMSISLLWSSVKWNFGKNSGKIYPIQIWDMSLFLLHEWTMDHSCGHCGSNFPFINFDFDAKSMKLFVRSCYFTSSGSNYNCRVSMNLKSTSVFQNTTFVRLRFAFLPEASITCWVFRCAFRDMGACGVWANTNAGGGTWIYTNSIFVNSGTQPESCWISCDSVPNLHIRTEHLCFSSNTNGYVVIPSSGMLEEGTVTKGGTCASFEAYATTACPTDIVDIISGSVDFTLKFCSMLDKTGENDRTLVFRGRNLYISTCYFIPGGFSPR
jgi:hypothetical protein